LPAATLPLEPVGLVKRVFLFEHSPCANLGLMMSLPHLHLPNLSHLPGKLTFMKILWIHILNHLRHLRFLRPTASASQIGHEIIQEGLHYPVHRVRSGARAVLAHSSDESHGVRWRQVYTMRRRKVT